jgi:hypothetical protein
MRIYACFFHYDTGSGCRSLLCCDFHQCRLTVTLLYRINRQRRGNYWRTSVRNSEMAKRRLWITTPPEAATLLYTQYTYDSTRDMLAILASPRTRLSSFRLNVGPGQYRCRIPAQRLGEVLPAMRVPFPHSRLEVSENTVILEH